MTDLRGKGNSKSEHQFGYITRLRPTPKLQMFWEKTPYTVGEIINDVVLKIRQTTTGKQCVVHVDYLQPVKGPKNAHESEVQVYPSDYLEGVT